MIKLTFLGTGTSQGVPVISCKCAVCTSDDPRDRRLRSSVMVETRGVRFIIDAGPDFRQQMLAHNVAGIDGILITHDHKDHIGGIDDVRAYNYTQRRAVDIYATTDVQPTIQKDYDYAFGDDRYPGVPDINLVTIQPNVPFRVKGIEVVPISGLHYYKPVLGFRIGALAYLTDFSHIEPEQIEKLKGVDTLVINALRKEKHLSHFTLSEAVAVARQVAPRQTFLTHVSHQMGLHATEGAQLPPTVHFAYDGLTVEIPEADD